MATYEERIGDTVRIKHEPGNGTHYEVIGTRLPFTDADDNWLVAFPLEGGCYYFRQGSCVTVSYVAEKIGKNRRGNEISIVDLHEMTKLIAQVVGGTHDAETDTRGNLNHLRIAR